MSAPFTARSLPLNVLTGTRAALSVMALLMPRIGAAASGTCTVRAAARLGGAGLVETRSQPSPAARQRQQSDPDRRSDVGHHPVH